MTTQFDAELAKLADMSDDELSGLESEIMAAFDAADEADDEAALAKLADALDIVRAEIAKRTPAPEEATPEPEPAVASAETTDSDDVEPEEQEILPAETETKTETAPKKAAEAEEVKEAKEAVVDTAPAKAPEAPEAGDKNEDINKEKEEEPVSASMGVPKNRAPVVTAPVSIVAAGADIPGVSAGMQFKNLEDYAQAFANRANSLGRLTGGDGEKVVIASITTTAGEDRTLKFGDPQGNLEKIKAVTDKSAIVASGGFCAPLATRYDLFGLGITDRPVRDSLPGFQADRGGIRFFTGPTLADLNAAVGFWDSAKDAAVDEEDPDTWKVIATVDCPTEQEVETYAVTLGLQFGTVASRVFPENVTANTNLAMVQFSRIAEAGLLSKIKAGSTAVNGPAVKYGAVRDLLLTVARAGAYFRSTHRLDRDFPLRAMLPAWLIDVLRSDAILGPPSTAKLSDNYGLSPQEIEDFFKDWDINVTWFLDGISTANAGNPYGPISGAALPEFPTSVEWSLFAEGSWLYLDSGTLDLGIIRDSKLARTNDYIQFQEGFESVAKIGGESLWITSPLAVTGRYAPPITAA